MKISILPLILFRIPQLPINSTLEESWDILKSSIQKASPNFYAVIADVKSSEIYQLPESVQQTIWKYFNRSKFRATPFGTFAGIVQIPIGQKQQIIIGQQSQKSFVDWSVTTTMNKTQMALKPNDLIFSNGSYYYRLDAIRYISLIEGSFTLSQLPFDEIIEAILLFCMKPITYFDLLVKLKSNYTQLANADKLVKGLIKCQLLFTSRHPNIIGEDYFKRINFSKTINTQPYLIAERKLDSGGIDKKLFNKLPALISRLQGMQQVREQKMLQDFRNKLHRKYESAAVPLLLALDPEMGIGYGDFTSEANTSDMLDFLRENTINNKSKDLLQKQFQNAISDYFFTKPFIDLKDIPVKEDDNILPLPNTFSLLGYQYNDQIVVEKIGGISANTLLGRFTLANEEILKTCGEIADIEQEANPNVIFFDVAYMGEPNVDNVNRRRAIYPFQLAILNYDTSANPISLNDLYVYVSGEEIVLRSQKLNRRVIPRIASAYNHGRSDLSIFRFLSDLQYQNIQSSLHVDLEAILPSRRFYPRLTFENFIISPAKWKLENRDIFKFPNLATYLDANLIPRHFRIGEGDQTLTFDRNNKADLMIFQKMLIAYKSVTIEEAFIPKDKFILDKQGNYFSHQMIIGVSHNEELYTDKKPRGYRLQQATCYPPGSEWLYFEIYTHSAYANDLLENDLQPFLKQWRKQITCFFFIRYEDQGEHIRLRIKVKDKINAYPIITALSEHLAIKISSGLVSSLRLNTYYPETHRYGNCMQAVERHFQMDSLYVLSLLKSNFSAQIKHILCAMLFEELVKCIGISQEAILALLNKISTSFNNEHNLKAIHFKRLNVEYNNFKNTIRPYLNEKQRKCLRTFIVSFKTTLDLYVKEMQPALFGDLMHMHINRLFHEKQRTHEMMIYYFVHKDFTRKSMQNSNAIHAAS